MAPSALIALIAAVQQFLAFPAYLCSLTLAERLSALKTRNHWDKTWEALYPTVEG